MLILKRSQFRIADEGNPDPPPVPGYISEHFGAHQCPISEDWEVFHLQTGFFVLRYLSFWEARGLMTVLESSGLDWHWDWDKNRGLNHNTVKAGRALVADFKRHMLNKRVGR